MNLKLQQLKHFTLVAEEKGFRNAASKANRSQAAISSSIKELESHLGAALFEHGNKARLTEFGEICLPKMQALLQQAERLESDLTAIAKGELGQVRVASIPSVASRLLPQVLSDFAGMLPGVKISLMDDTAERVAQRLLAGEVDMAIANQRVAHPDLHFEPLFSDPIGVACSLHHPLAQLNRPLHWQDLQGETCIYNGIVPLFKHTPLYDLMEQSPYRISNMMSLYPLLEQQVGITLLPRLAMSAAHPQLVWLPMETPSVTRIIGLLTVISRTLSPAADRFYQLCRQQLIGEPD